MCIELGTMIFCLLVLHFGWIKSKTSKIYWRSIDPILFVFRINKFTSIRLFSTLVVVAFFVGVLKGPFIYFFVFDSRSPSKDKQSFCFLTDASIWYFHEWIALLRHWCIDPNKKSNKFKFVPLRYLLNAKILFMSMTINRDLPSMK